MNQSAIKTKIITIAFFAMVFVCALLIVGVVEIKKYHDYKQTISSQEQLIQELQNAKDYYNSPNYEENSLRDSDKGNDGDLVFDVEEE